MKIRIGNDIKMICSLVESGSAVDLTKVQDFEATIILNNGDDNLPTTTATNISIDSNLYNYEWFLYNAPCVISGAVVYIYFPAIELVYLGNYNLLVTYKKQSSTNSAILNNYTVDAENVFTLVKSTRLSSDAGNMNITFDGENLAFPYTFTLTLS